MKKFVLACLLALPLTAASRQEASAWCDFKIHAGFSFACHCNGICCCPAPCGDGCGGGMVAGPAYGVPDAGYGYGADAGYVPDSGYGAPYTVGQAPVSAPAVPVQYQAGYAPTSGYTPVGYFQAPAYWYGR